MFEYGEQRDADGNITHNGSWGVKSAPKEAITKIIENFRVLHDSLFTLNSSMASGIVFKGVFDNLASVNLSNPQNGWGIIIRADEDHGGIQTVYVYQNNQWQYVCPFENREITVVDKADSIDWTGIANRPKSTVTQIDDAVTKALVAESNAKEYADGLIKALVNGSPEMLDTLNEIAEALNNDPNFSTTILNLLSEKETPEGAQAKVDTSASKINTRIDNEVSALNATITNKDLTQTSALTTHKAGDDHDGRYYTESEIDSKLNIVDTKISTHRTSTDHDSRYYTEPEIDSMISSVNINVTNGDTANSTAIATHKTSSDHDGRYYTETEIDGKIDALDTKIAAKLDAGISYSKAEADFKARLWAIILG